MIYGNFERYSNFGSVRELIHMTSAFFIMLPKSVCLLLQTYCMFTLYFIYKIHLDPAVTVKTAFPNLDGLQMNGLGLRIFRKCKTNWKLKILRVGHSYVSPAYVHLCSNHEFSIACPNFCAVQHFWQ